MTKRPSIDLLALTTEKAAPMPEAVQRMAKTPPSPPRCLPEARIRSHRELAWPRLQSASGLPQTLPPGAANADLKLNELLFEALAAWEEKQGIKG